MSGTSPPHIRLNPELKISLSEIEKALIRRLFPQVEEVVVEAELKGGYIARVLLVIPWSDGLAQAAQVVKIGPRQQAINERGRFTQHVQPMLPLLATQMTGFAQQGAWGAIAYAFLGKNTLGKTVLLQDYYRAQPTVEIATFLEKLLVDALGQRFYDQKRPTGRQLYYQDFYSRTFLPDLTIAADAISTTPLPPDNAYDRYTGETAVWQLHDQIESGQSIQLNDFLVEKHTETTLTIRHPTDPFRIRVTYAPKQAPDAWPAPAQPVRVRGRVTHTRHQALIEIVQTIFSGTDQAALTITAGKIEVAGTTYAHPLALYRAMLKREMPPNMSLIHGDLHLFNVMVDSFNKPWVIDFGRTGEGHALFDFIELETHLRHAILGETDFSPSEWLDFEQRLLCAMTTQPPPAPPSHPELTKAFTVIQGIRQHAQKYARRQDSFVAEYLPALFLYSLATLKYYRSNGTCSAWHAFLTAVAVATYLENQLNCHDLSPQLTITDPMLEFHVFYLRRAAGDDEAARQRRHLSFVAELQQIYSSIRRPAVAKTGAAA